MASHCITACVLLSVTLPASLWAGTPATPEAEFGQLWVRTHPFTIMGLAWDPLDVAEFEGSGLNLPMAYSQQAAADAAAAGMDWHGIHFETQLTINAKVIILNFTQNRGATGYTFKDEIIQPQMQGVGDITEWVRTMRDQGIMPDDMLIYIGSLDARAENYDGFWPGGPSDYNHSDYIDDIVQYIKPETLLYHHHPFVDYGPTVMNSYFYNMLSLRTKAQEHGLPYFAWLQSFVATSTPEIPYTPWTRPASESEMAMQVFSHLAAGFKGFDYYTYDDINNSLVSGLLDGNGNPSSMYTWAQANNSQVAVLGQAMRFLDSTDYRFIGNPLSNTPDGISDWTVGAGADPNILDIEIVGAVSAGKDAVIGHFTDDAGGLYFMLVNIYHGAALSSSAAFLQFRITFDDSINQIMRLNRLNGESEIISLTNHQLLFALNGGVGDLFKYDTSTPFFMGIEGDVNRDGVVDSEDIAIIQENWMLTGGAGHEQGDVNGDGNVNQADLDIVNDFFGMDVLPPWAEPMPGDLDGDGFVGIADLNVVLGNWNQLVPPGNPQADPSGDGFVGIEDLNEVLGNWNTGMPPTGVVPEPGTLALIGAGAFAALPRRR